VAEPSDEALMAEIRRRDEQAFTRLLARHLDPVHRYLKRLTGSAADADDLAQETFLRVWEKADTYRAGQVAVTTWIHRIAHNRAMDWFRSRRTRAATHPDADPAEQAAADPTPLQARLRSERGARLEAALRRLPESQRSALLLCHVQGLTNRDAAVVMAVSVRALESLLARARRRLKTELLSSEDDPTNQRGQHE
jgi:RNA polymerase sigma-70 factor (ECF subfamily)